MIKRWLKDDLKIENEAKQRKINLVTIETSEFAKVDGALTCKSILISSQKYTSTRKYLWIMIGN